MQKKAERMGVKPKNQNNKALDHKTRLTLKDSRERYTNTNLRMDQVKVVVYFDATYLFISRFIA